MRYVFTFPTIMLTGVWFVRWRTATRVKTTGLMGILLVIFLSVPLPAAAQQAGKVYRVGYLSRSGTIHEVFKQQLRELGYVEGENIIYFVGETTGIKARATELVRLKVDVIVTRSTPAARAAKQATTTIPIVMHAGGNPVNRGLVASLKRPGGNITGLTAGVERGLYGRHLELLKELVPKLSRVAVLWNPRSRQNFSRTQKSLKHTAESLGLKIQSLEVRSPDDLKDAFQAATENGAQGLITFRHAPILDERKRVVALAMRSRLPAVYGDKAFVLDGGLMSYGADFAYSFGRQAIYVDKILKGASPATLPIERAEKLELVINLKTATTMGLSLPAALLYQADELIK